MAAGDGEHLVISLSRPEPTTLTQALQEKYPCLKITYHHLPALAWNLDQLPDEMYKDATIIASLSAMPSRPKAAPKMGSSKGFVQVFSAGTNHLAKSSFFNGRNITFCNCSGLHGPAIAEWVIMTMLVHTRWYNMMYDRQKEGHWIDESVRGRMLHEIHDSVGRRIGILGYGSIGRQVARVSKAMGLQVVAYTSSPRSTPESRKDHGYIVPGTGDPNGEYPDEWFSGKDKQSLHRFLGADLDYLVVSVPLTKSTIGLLGEEEFKVLSRKKTFVSNVARGEIIDTAALLKAVKLFNESQGQDGISGAALDVTSPEPLPKDHELWYQPNVTITPHTSGVIHEWLPRCFEILDINLDRYFRGKSLLNQIDREGVLPIGPAGPKS